MGRTPARRRLPQSRRIRRRVYRRQPPTHTRRARQDVHGLAQGDGRPVRRAVLLPRSSRVDRHGRKAGPADAQVPNPASAIRAGRGPPVSESKQRSAPRCVSRGALLWCVLLWCGWIRRIGCYALLTVRFPLVTSASRSPVSVEQVFPDGASFTKTAILSAAAPDVLPSTTLATSTWALPASARATSAAAQCSTTPTPATREPGSAAPQTSRATTKQNSHCWRGPLASGR